MSDSLGTFDSRYDILREIGAGVYGEVYEALDVQNNYQQVAVKMYKRDVDEELEDIEDDWVREKTAYEQVASTCNDIPVACEHVVSMIGNGIAMWEGDERYYIALVFERFSADLEQLCETDLLAYSGITDRDDTLRTFIRLSIAAQLVRSVLVLHDMGVIHRDLHSNNVLVVDAPGTEISDAEWELRLGPRAAEQRDSNTSNLERYLYAKSSRDGNGFNGDLQSEIQFLRETCEIRAKLIDLNMAATEVETKVDGSLRDPTLRRRNYTLEQTKVTDAWDVGLMLYEIATGQRAIDAFYDYELWKNAGLQERLSQEVLRKVSDDLGLAQIPSNRDAIKKQAVWNRQYEITKNIRTKADDYGDIIKVYGRSFTGYLTLPKPFEQFSKLLSFDYRERMALDDVYDELRLMLDSF